MSQETPKEPTKAPELKDESLEEVAGGIYIHDTILPYDPGGCFPPPIIDDGGLTTF